MGELTNWGEGEEGLKSEWEREKVLITGTDS